MGAIQNSINQAMAAAAVSGRLIKSQQSQDINAGIAAKEELPELDKKQAELLDESLKNIDKTFQSKNDLETLKTMEPKEDAPLEDRRAYSQLITEVMDDERAAKKAFEQLEKREAAIKERRARAERAIKRAKNWGGNL